jgi:hypothetical protein
MRNVISKTIVAGVAALSLAASAFATAEPASAQTWHGGGGGWHGGGGYWHHGYWRGGRWYGGWWGPAVAAGVLLGAAAYPYYGYGYGYGYGGCWQNRPVYSPTGVYLGYQMVNVCQ